MRTTGQAGAEAAEATPGGTGHPGRSWDTYLRRFHGDRPGITEAVLRRARDDDGTDPYAWLAAVLPGHGTVVDLGCGSGPLHAQAAGRRWIGVDASAAELAAARAAGAWPLLLADAGAIPMRDAGADSMACSMSLMVAGPLDRVLAEIARVLAPGGTLVATIPAGGPLRAADRAVLAGLVAALGAAPAFPAGRSMPRIPSMLAGFGLPLLADERQRFAYPLRGPTDADRFLDSLYLPGLPHGRYRLARAYLHTLARRHVDAPITLRRIVARRSALPAQTPTAGQQ
jgi:SAM-dependent methyltransferase